MGVAGQFRHVSGTINLDRDQPERSSVSASIEVNSLDTGNKKRDEHLRSAEFFDAARFPEIRFKSRQVKRTSGESADVTGELTMHGITRVIVLHVKMLAASVGDRSRWQITTAPLDRKDFNLAFSSGAEAISGISRKVSIKIEIEAGRVP